MDWGVQRREEGLGHAGAHSHFSPDKLQYVVFDSSQIIPCYVLHLDYGGELAEREFARLPSNPQQAKKAFAKYWRDPDVGLEPQCPGALLAKKQALKAAASKWFPYGFGPAVGTSFVIEEIGEVSDDEEEYGDFQAARVGQEREVRERRLDAGGSWFDEYQTVRKTKKAQG